MQEDCPTFAKKVDSRCRVVSLRSFMSCLASVLFSGPSLLEMKFYRNFFRLVFVLFWGFLNQLPSRRQMQMCLLRWRQNTLGAGDEHYSAGDKHVGASAARTQLSTSDFQTDLMSMIVTHWYLPPKQVVSHPRIHLRVHYIHN